MSIKKLSLLLLFILTISCGTNKNITGSATANTAIGTKQLVKTINANATNFKTLSGRLEIETLQGSKSQSFNVSMRWEKDKAIWISKLGIVKAMITPTRVAFYNKLDNTYFDGDFEYLSKIVGTELDFNKLQNILLGETLFNLDDKTYKHTVNENAYVFQPKQQRELFEIFFIINPNFFKTNSQQITQTAQKRLLQIDYLNYQKVETITVPEQIKIIAIEDESEMQINLELKGLDLDRELKLPFNIPSGYEEIKL